MIPGQWAFRLTRRELQVLRLICAGFSTKEIAAQLGTSFKTAMCHRSHVLEKCQVRNAVQLYPWALKNGLIQEDSDAVSEQKTRVAPSAGMIRPAPPSRDLPQPLNAKPSSLEELLANEEYGRILYERFKLKIEVQSRAAKTSAAVERMNWLKAAAKSARAIYRAAQKARADFENTQI